MPQVPILPVGESMVPLEGGTIPQPQYETSRAFNQMSDAAGFWGDKFLTHKVEEEASQTQTEAGTTPKIATGLFANTKYGEAWNRTAATLYGSNKEADIRERTSKLYFDNQANPQGLAQGLEDLKGDVFKDVPPLWAPIVNKYFQDRSSTLQSQAQTNYDVNEHDTAAGMVDNRMQNLISEARQIAAIGQLDPNNQAFVDNQAAWNALKLEASDPDRKGGPLIPPNKLAAHEQVMKYNLREGELIYGFYSQPTYDSRKKYVDDLVRKQDDILPLDKVAAVERQLRTALAEEASKKSEAAGLYAQNVANIIALKKEGDPNGQNIDTHGLILKGLSEAGISTLQAAKLQKQLDIADYEGGAKNEIRRSSVQGIGAVIDRIQQDLQRTSESAGTATPTVSGTAPIDYYTRVRAAESGGRGNVNSGTSTAEGTFGITTPTYNALVAKHPELAGASKSDPSVVSALTSDNADIFRKTNGRDPTYSELYTLHFFGAGDATKVMNASPDTPLDQLVSKKVIDDNHSVTHNPDGSIKTAGETLTELSRRIGGNVSPDIETLAAKYQAVNNIRTFAEKAVHEMTTDPIKWAQENHLISASQVDLNNTDSVAQRAKDVATVSARFGVDAPFFRNDEASAFSKTFQQLDSSSKLHVIDTLNDAKLTPQQESSTLRQLDPHNPALSILPQLVAKDDSGFSYMRNSAIKALDGIDVLRDNKDLIPHKGTFDRTNITLMESMIPRDPQGKIAQAYGEMLSGHFASSFLRDPKNLAISSESDAVSKSKTNFANFFGYPKFSDMPQVNEHPIIPWKNSLSKDEASSTFRSINDDDLRGLGGGSLPVDVVGTHSHEITSADIRSHGYPIPGSKSGQYFIAMDGVGGPIILKDKQGEPVLWNPQTQPHRTEPGYLTMQHWFSQ